MKSEIMKFVLELQIEKKRIYVMASVASSREPNSAYHTGGLPRGVFSCSSRMGTTGLKN